MARPWPVIVQMLEARSERMNRAERSNKPAYPADAEVIVTDDVSQLGLGRG